MMRCSWLDIRMESNMRTTVTLDDDLAVQLKRVTREQGISFKEAVNSAIRTGLGGRRASRKYRLPTYRMGVRPGINLDRALELDAALEDQEIVRKLEIRK